MMHRENSVNDCFQKVEKIDYTKSFTELSLKKFIKVYCTVHVAHVWTFELTLIRVENCRVIVWCLQPPQTPSKSYAS